MNNKALKTLLLCGVSFCATSFSFGSPCSEVKAKVETPLFAKMVMVQLSSKMVEVPLFLTVEGMPSFPKMVQNISKEYMEFPGASGQAAMGDVLAFDDEKEAQAWPIIDVGIAYLTLWVMRGNQLNSDRTKNIMEYVIASLQKIDLRFVEIFHDSLKDLTTICRLRERIIAGEESITILVDYLRKVSDYFNGQKLREYELAYWKYFLLFGRFWENSGVFNAFAEVVNDIILGSGCCEKGDPLEDIFATDVNGNPLWLLFYARGPETLLKLLKVAVPSSPIHTWKAKRSDGTTLALTFMNVQAKCKEAINYLLQHIRAGEKLAKNFEEYFAKIYNYVRYSDQTKAGMAKFLEDYLLSKHGAQLSVLAMAFKNENVWYSFCDIFRFLLRSTEKAEGTEKTLIIKTITEMLLTQAPDGTPVWEKVHYYNAGLLDKFVEITDKDDPRLNEEVVGVLGEKIRLGDVHVHHGDDDTVGKAWDQCIGQLQERFEAHN